MISLLSLGFISFPDGSGRLLSGFLHARLDKMKD